MSKVLSLIFTEDFFAATVLKNGEVSLLEVDGFQLLPLFYEVKNDSIVYPLGKEEFASAQGRTTFGDYFQLIDGNTTFSLFGTHYALVTIITHVLDRIKEKYRQATENQAEQITTILTLPTNASGRAKDRLKDFLGKRGFKIVQEISLAQAIKLNYSRLSKIGILDSLGKGRIEFEVLSESDQYNENIYDFYEEKSREQLTKMVFEKALQSSFSSLVNDEVGKSVEYKQYIYLAKEWLTKLKLKAEIDIHFTFSDGYTGSTTLTRAAADELMIDATLILNKIRTLQDKVKVSAPLQGIFLLGKKLDNKALFTSLQQEFSTDKIFSLATNDVKAVKEISAGVLLANQKQFPHEKTILNQQQQVDSNRETEKANKLLPPTKVTDFVEPVTNLEQDNKKLREGNSNNFWPIILIVMLISSLTANIMIYNKKQTNQIIIPKIDAKDTFIKVTNSQILQGSYTGELNDNRRQLSLKVNDKSSEFLYTINGLGDKEKNKKGTIDLEKQTVSFETLGEGLLSQKDGKYTITSKENKWTFTKQNN